LVLSVREVIILVLDTGFKNGGVKAKVKPHGRRGGESEAAAWIQKWFKIPPRWPLGLLLVQERSELQTLDIIMIVFQGGDYGGVATGKRTGYVYNSPRAQLWSSRSESFSLFSHAPL
jgi:hypothetical protein